MSLRKPTVLMVDKYHFIKGGAERYLFELTAILKSHGHRVVFFSMKHPQNFPSPYESYFVTNIDFHPRSFFQKIRLIFLACERVFYSIEARWRLERLLRKTRPDVAHLHMIDHQISPSILHTLKKHRIPIVQTLHQYKLICPNYLLYIPWKRRLCTRCVGSHVFHPLWQRCHKRSLWASGFLVLEAVLHRTFKMYHLVDRYHVPSRFMGQMMGRGHFPFEKMVYHPYCIDLTDFPQSRTFESFYLYVGRLSPEKGLHTLLETARRVPAYPLVVIGDGPEREGLEQRVKRDSLGHVTFFGNLEKAEVIRWLSRTRCMVVPSEWFENSPLVIYEAFALGKPVIGSDIGGISELITHGKDGYLFPPGDAETCAHYLRLLMEDESSCRLMGNRAREKAVRWFSGETHYDFILSLYRALITQRMRANP